jgi:hypothetical protein
MREIIHDKIYDTEKATEIIKKDNSSFSTDTLYKTPKGNFFITRHCFTSGISRIRPITIERAKKKYGNTMSIEKYQEVFDIIIEEA